MLTPRRSDLDAMIIEFKVFSPRRENAWKKRLKMPLKQIEEKDYARELKENGIHDSRIRCYGFAFRGKEVLIEGR